MPDGLQLGSCMDPVDVDGVFVEYRVGIRGKIVSDPLEFMRVSCNGPLRANERTTERHFC